MLGNQGGSQRYDRADLLAIQPQDQGFAAREVAIECSGTDPSRLRNRVQGRRRISCQRIACHIQNAVPVRLCVCPQIFVVGHNLGWFWAALTF
jgi:hypothetical protein